MLFQLPLGGDTSIFLKIFQESLSCFFVDQLRETSKPWMKVTPLKVSIFQRSAGAICCICNFWEYVISRFKKSQLNEWNFIAKVIVFKSIALSYWESLHDFNSVVIARLLYFKRGLKVFTRTKFCKKKANAFLLH